MESRSSGGVNDAWEEPGRTARGKYVLEDFASY